MACLCLSITAQNLTQTIRGIVTDKASATPIAYTTIQVEDTSTKELLQTIGISFSKNL
ncbi:hypothetical protein [Phocaeicola faecalis]